MNNNVVSMLEKAASIVSQQEAMAHSLCMLDHGSRLFDVPSGWQSRAIRQDASVSCCMTLLELEAAVRDPAALVIFIPHGALIAASDIERIITRNGATKTLFKEVLA